MKTSDVFKVSYGVTLGFMCAKFTMSACCGAIKKLCDIGIEKNQKVSYKPYYTSDKKELCKLEEGPDGVIKVKCSSRKMLYDLLENVDSMVDSYGYFSFFNLKDLIGYTSECTDIEIGWLNKDSYHVVSKEKALIFTKPIDISDFSCEASCDLCEEEKEEETTDEE